MGFLYQIGIRLYGALIRLAALTNTKANLWVSGRKQLFNDLSEAFQGNTDPVHWFHCASLGEFEQARPIIERLKKESPDIKVLISFYSPSGYEIRKDYEEAFHVCYLPLDTRKNAQHFVNIVQPAAVYFVKYEFWFNLLDCLRHHKIPTFLIAGIFHEKQVFFGVFGGWASKKLIAFKHFFVQTKEAKLLLQKIGYENCTVAGDTRFDRVYETAHQTTELPIVQNFCQGQETIIAGSTWPDDENVLIPFYNNYSRKVKLIIAPHEIHESHIKDIELKLKRTSVRFSQVNEDSDFSDTAVLIIDNIGYLSSMYQYGNLAYIGGAFHGALHNILEAVTFGLPVIFGPEYQKFPEAGELLEMGGAFSITDATQLEHVIDGLNFNQVMAINKQYIASKTGASEMILRKVKELIP